MCSAMRPVQKRSCIYSLDEDARQTATPCQRNARMAAAKRLYTARTETYCADAFSKILRCSCCELYVGRLLLLLQFRALTVPAPLHNQLSFSYTIPSIDKGKHACQRVFPLLFALFALAGARPPASQKLKIIRKYIAGRCGAVLPEQKWVQTRKDPQRILAVLSRGLTQYGHISARQNRVCPCQSMVPINIRFL